MKIVRREYKIEHHRLPISDQIKSRILTENRRLASSYLNSLNPFI